MKLYEATIVKKAEELGYTLIIEDGKIDYIYPANRKQDRYTLELYSPRKAFGETKPWTIQTVSYGALDSEEITKVIEGLKRAQEMVAHLEHSGIPVS